MSARLIGFTGTQKGMTVPQSLAVRSILSDRRGVWLHHGDCVGADAQAHVFAKATGYLLAIHPPINWRKRAWCIGFDRRYPEKDYIARNHEIVDVTDELIAAPAQAQEERRSGTWATIRYARKQRKLVTIVFPDGSLEFSP